MFLLINPVQGEFITGTVLNMNMSDLPNYRSPFFKLRGFLLIELNRHPLILAIRHHLQEHGPTTRNQVYLPVKI